jgi:hypothetical protein
MLLSELRKAANVEHPLICFFRARADETVWVSDCGDNKRITKPSIQQHVLEGHDGWKDAVEKVFGNCRDTELPKYRGSFVS